MHGDISRPRPPFASRPVAALATAVTGPVVALAGSRDYHCDELYFRVLAEHPRWGYPDQPPFTPMIARAGIAAFGDTVLGPRILSAVFVGIIGIVLALIVGVVVGLGLYNKLLVATLLIALGAGLLIFGPREVFRSRCAWAGAAIALVVGSPNLVYQVVNDFPQLEMAEALANADKTQSNPRGRLLPMQLVILGPLAFPICAAGVANVALSCLIVFPPVVDRDLGSSPLGKINIVLVNQVGWPAYVGNVASVYRELPPEERVSATIVTANSW